MGRKIIDLKGKKLGKLTVLYRVKDRFSGSSREAWWQVHCSCGKTVSMRGYMLRDARVHSCGCMKGFRHGLCNTPEYILWVSTKCRAKKSGIPFDLEISDIKIPDQCPLLQIPIFKGVKKHGPNSPTVDRIIPKKGYTKENIQIVSYRANVIKQDASFQELYLIAKNLEKIVETPIR